MNVGREYWRGRPGIDRWRDTHMAVRGPAVLALQESFGRDWLAATGELIEGPETLTPPGPIPGGECIVQAVATGPDRDWPALDHLYLQAMALARERVWITTPYFVPTESVETSLATVALRGVDVRILVPGTVDSRIVGWASRSWFPDLVEAGVRIWTYDPGFVHAKCMVVDDWLTVLGSANLDARSFHLNYELTAFVYGPSFLAEVARQFEADLAVSSELDAARVLTPSLPRRLLLNAARLASPLL